jgi:VanZ family protein
MSSERRVAPSVGRIASPGPTGGPGRDLRGVGHWISAWLPVLIGVYVIVLESTPMFGADHTSGPLRRIFEALFGPVGNAGWDLIHHYMRKTGHFIGYGTLGLVWLRAWRMTLPGARFLSQAGLALLGTAVVASCDEWHQTFLPNRTGTPWDVLLDCCGAAVMIGMAWLYLRTYRHSQAAC